MDAAQKAALVKRLKSISGHVAGIAAMLENDRYCIDILQQIQAVQAALSKVSQMVLDNHLHTCLIEAVRSDDAEARDRAIAEISQIFGQKNK